MLHLIDDSAPGGAVAAGEEPEREREKHQERHTSLGGETPEQERGERGTGGGYERRGCGGEGEVFVVAEVAEEGGRDYSREIEDGEKEGGGGLG